MGHPHGGRRARGIAGGERCVAPFEQELERTGIMSDAPNALLEATALLDFHHPDIQALVARRAWSELKPYDRIGSVYDFVRNEIAFGYNESDELPASRVLADGIGQCNTKGVLLMALLRAVGIPCRFHGFTIDKPLQKGAITGIAYWLAPQRIIHSWVEVQLDGRWITLEGFILDAPYLNSLQKRFPDARRFCGYGAATPDLSAPQVEWEGGDTFIQKEGIADDFGRFDSPDAFYKKHGSNLSGFKRWLYEHIVRHWMNQNVARVRASIW
jgi:transglutaminase-like putative cysteine protease